MAPRRIEDATAVAERIRPGVRRAAPMLGCASGGYPAVFRAMRQRSSAWRHAMRARKGKAGGSISCAWSTNDASAPIEEQVHVNAEDFGDVRQPVGRNSCRSIQSH